VLYYSEPDQAVVLPDGSIGLLRTPSLDAPKYSRWAYIETPESEHFATHIRRRDLIFLGDI